MKCAFKGLMVVLLVAMQFTAGAQLPVSVENLTDEQLMQLVSKYQLSGLSEVELDAKAREYGIPSDQVLILKKRLAVLQGSGGLTGENTSFNNKTNSYVLRDKVFTKGPSRKEDSLGILNVFGSEIFDNADLSFEPNLNIATPANYVIGVNDQLVIDVYGVSDNTSKLKVTTEGDIRFPKYGPIKVAGLTVDEARVKIKNALTRIYPGIASGSVHVQVAIGQTRSIQVSLIGEVRKPGRYTLSALATLMTALYASGGPNDIGTLRNVELVRNGKLIVSFDLYDFIMKADLSKNILLQDDDVIRIKPYETRVALRGAVKKQALFDVKPGESAADILAYAGGFADIAFKEMLRVTRLGQSSKEIISVKGNALAKFIFQSGDTLAVDKLSNLYANRVIVTGSVYHPGAYGIAQIPSLQELLTIARPREEAYYDRALLRRYKPDYTSSIINFNVRDALNGTFTLKLEREDSIHIYVRDELREKYTVTINGEVNNPGVYAFSENMTAQDVVLLANGYREGASLQKIEISRRLKTDGRDSDTSLYSVIKEINLANAGTSDLEFKLNPFDVISVRKSSTYKEQINVTVEGEVRYPGKYTLSASNERISDIIKRAGGLKSNAFTDGARLIRNVYVGISQSDASLLATKANLINKQSGRVVAPSAVNDSVLVNTLSDQQQLVSIRLTEALTNPGSKDDLFLEEGDILKIPKTIQTIQTFGMVNVPKQIIFHPGLTFKDAILESGGFSVNASRRHAYVVYPNGEVTPTRNFLFFRSYPRLKTGAEIYVPAKSERKKLTTGETIGLISGLTSVLGLVVILVNTK
ncbi:capsule biosynthesis protein [Sediminibacterium roseum]|uniref:Capsule biosynthesis protein n=1 Tax=Sediminibacterium roseum TaxID=1978412 RepID=A0ABW9ZPT2_9BACT|nr:SLBB domain-containing protein [Sediminibacterium roseum]NCI49111.1 capsule biosynthesis protein [Sediminibacterium roseum]